MTATLVIYSSVNKKGINPATGRAWKDATGAFVPGADQFAMRVYDDVKKRGIDCVNQSPAKRFEDLMMQFKTTTEVVGTVAIFCHGWRNGLQVGVNTKNVDVFVDRIRQTVLEDTTFVLYACSAAAGGPGGDGGFADKLRDSLCAHRLRNCVVYAHTTVGHAYRNPNVRVFLGDNSPVGGMGGSWLVAPSSPLWPKWKRAMADGANDLWARFPLIPVADLHHELLAK